MKKGRVQKDLVLRRINILFQQAADAFRLHPERSHRYVKLARALAMKARMSMPLSLRRKYCKHCYTYFQPSITCRVRTRNDMVVYSCFSCKKYTKIPYGKRLKKTK